MSIAAIIAIVALVGGGASFAADGAVPGSILYPVKVNVNEGIAAAFSLSTEAKADWATWVAERRLHEAARLAADGNMSADVRARLEEQFSARAEDVQARMADLDADGKAHAAASVASRLESSLEAHERVLAQLEAKDEDVKPIRARIAVLLGTLKGVRAGLENKIAVSAQVEAGSKEDIELKALADRKLKTAEEMIASTHVYIESKKAELGARAVAEAEARLNVARDFYAQAKARMEAQAYGEAFILCNRAISVAHEARILAEAQSRFRIEIGGGPTTDADASADADVRVDGTANESDVRGSGEIRLETGL